MSRAQSWPAKERKINHRSDSSLLFWQSQIHKLIKGNFSWIKRLSVKWLKLWSKEKWSMSLSRTLWRSTSAETQARARQLKYICPSKAREFNHRLDMTLHSRLDMLCSQRQQNRKTWKILSVTPCSRCLIKQSTVGLNSWARSLTKFRNLLHRTEEKSISSNQPRTVSVISCRLLARWAASTITAVQRVVSKVMRIRLLSQSLAH